MNFYECCDLTEKVYLMFDIISIDIACLLGIDPASPEWNRGREGGRRGQDEVHVITEEEFQQEMSNLVKKMKLALGDLRNFLSDKYADSMANQSGCITQ